MDRPNTVEKHDERVLDILIVSFVVLCVLTSIILVGSF
jgi:hypothetical protein